MTILDNQRVIAIEEHYYDPEVVKHFDGRDGKLAGFLKKTLLDVGKARIDSMDEAGIDVQVLSHGAPSTQKLAADIGPGIAAAANDRLYEICQTNPDRLAGFANLATVEPVSAADELERAVKQLGFKGAMIHGLTGGELFIDDQRFWPIFERAEALDVPIYLHPGIPHEKVIEAYLGDYIEKYPGFLNAGWGFTLETATAGIRMVLSGIFKKYPNLKIILGHLGETLPFLMWRIDLALNRPGNDGVEFRKIFSNNFYITTSGFFSDPALMLCIQEMSADHILFAIDYPFVPNEPGPKWMERIMLNSVDKAKILHGNSEKLLKL